MPKNDLLSRAGCFRIDDRLVHCNPSLALRILSTCLITRAEYMYCSRQFAYEAYSPHFDVLPDGVMIPEYKPVVHGEKFMWWKAAEGEQEREG